LVYALWCQGLLSTQPTFMIYLIPPVPNQETNWRLRAEYPEGAPRVIRSFTISEDVAKVFADKGIPVVRLGRKPVGATEAALIEALDEIDCQNLRINKRVRREILYAIDLLGGESRLPEVYWESRRTWENFKEALSRYESVHADLMKYAAEQLGLPEGTVLVEGTHKCVKSPTRSCLYNHDEDRCPDECLVCGQPGERK